MSPDFTAFLVDFAHVDGWVARAANEIDAPFPRASPVLHANVVFELALPIKAVVVGET